MRRGELRYPIMKRTSALAVSAIAAFAISAIASGARAQTPAWTYAFPQSLSGAGWFSPLRNDNYYSGAPDFQAGSNEQALHPATRSAGVCRRRTARGLELQRNEF
jgi:hypothetical protein